MDEKDETRAFDRLVEVAYYDIVGKPLPVPPLFQENGCEGNRVGYFCQSCGVAFPIRQNRLRWDHSGVASNGTCPCGGSVIGIYRTRDDPKPTNSEAKTDSAIKPEGDSDERED